MKKGDINMKISDRFEKKVCTTCENNLLCNKDMKQLTACATLEIWNILIKKQYNVGMDKSILNGKTVIYVCPECNRIISEKEWIEEQEEGGTGGFCYCLFHEDRTLVDMIKKVI